MTRRGVFAVDRGIFDHPMFAREAFTEREAWLWLLSEAAYEPVRVRVGRGVFDLVRGQLAHATRYMATRWRWSEARVRRFLKRLETDAMISALATREATQITICNYDKHQFGRRTDEDEIDAPASAQATHSRRKEEEINKPRKEEGRKESSLRSDAHAREAAFHVEFEDWYAGYPHKVGRAAALKSYLAARRKGTTPDELRAGLTRYIASKPSDRAWCNPATWLNQERWRDAPAPVVPIRSGGPPRQTMHDLLAEMTQGQTDEQPLDYDLDLTANSA